MGDEIIRIFGQLYEAEMSRRRNEDYEVNPEQMDLFLALLDFFRSRVDPEYDDGMACSIIRKQRMPFTSVWLFRTRRKCPPLWRISRSGSVIYHMAGGKSILLQLSLS